MSAGRFVLENQAGEVVRTFNCAAEDLIIVYRHDTRRIEVVGNLSDLERDGISFDVLKKTTASSASKRPVTLQNGARFRFTKHIERVPASVNGKDDSREEETTIYTYTAATQVGLLALVFLIGLLIEPLFIHHQQEEIVTVMPQRFIQKQEAITVKAAEHKVDPVKHVANQKVESKVKHVSKILTAKVKAPHKANAPLRTKVQVEKIGALGVLGGMRTGSQRSSGFNMAANNDSQGTSWQGVGNSGAGGLERAIPGHGLSNGPMGSSQAIETGGGYSTRGKAGGGRAGYGNMNMGGTAGAYFEPVQEEAMVEGGLDKEQIKAVIDRHIGEVIYCYERGLQVQSSLNGRVGIRWVIDRLGNVQNAAIESTSLNNSKVEGCIASHLRGWKFPKPVGGVNVKVSYPFVLKRVNHG